ncbi:DUF349 domain-containing protein [Phycicoccus sp. CSK15P-2]|uniref:DUF349 domain-containing protein n=1 Tax=Phycicoccus sp. CSK15P-2 TaxID=2807627 RepID=UPI00194DE1E1|nr:DUF349 domain-containing protein [Phycicoccus sp. CSK15P-2]MBM6403903.1 DUF349 domain-containing protein [Phycicoccus sp. CSK15P-2]
MSEDQPTPRPPVPSPASLAKRVPPRPTAPAVRESHSESARFGRVDDDGRVFVQVGGVEQEVGSYPGASHEEALQYFARKYDELHASAELLEARLGNPEVSAKEVSDGLRTLKEHIAEAHVVGDLPALHAIVERVEAGLGEKRAAEAEHRQAARLTATTEREAIVVQAEEIAAQPAERTQWKQSGERMRALLDEWKQHQRSAAKLDKATETELWHRFSKARNTFDKGRRAWFAELETTRADAKRTKQRLVTEAESLASSTDWGPTARAYKQLMDQWRAAGRASRSDDDALWERFRAAQDAFFTAKDSAAAAEDEAFRGNLAVKEELLVEAEALLPVRDLEAAKTSLRSIQDRWDAAGKVPRADIDRVEKRIRRVESAVREAEDAKWQRTNPEVAARARSMVDQLEASVSAIEAEVAAAEAAGNETKAEAARERLSAQQDWLAQARAGLDEFGG